jgi:hypothetical protein
MKSLAVWVWTRDVESYVDGAARNASNAVSLLPDGSCDD